MAQYQNFFTQVQVRSTVYPGIPLQPGTWVRTGEGKFNYWLGKLGDAQVGPIYLGFTGIASIICGIVAIEIIGLNMLASVNWSPIEFVRQLPWLSLDPPKPEYGISIPPLREGGWWLMAGFSLTTSILLWWIRTYRRARALGMGTHVSWAFASAIWLYLVLGFIRPLLMGHFSEAVPFGIFPISTGPTTSPSPTATCSTIRSICSRSRFSMDRRCCSRCTAPPSSRSAATAASASSNRSSIAERRWSGRPCSGAGPWDSTPPRSRFTAGLGGSPCFAPYRRHRDFIVRYRRRQLVRLGSEARTGAAKMMRSATGSERQTARVDNSEMPFRRGQASSVLQVQRA